MRSMQTLITILLLPIRSVKRKYIPLLLIYFAYGSSAFSAIATNFWIKNNLDMTAVELAELGVWLFLPWNIKMIFGQMVDSMQIFGSNRAVYVYIGAILLFMSLFLMVLTVGQYEIIRAYDPQTLYTLSAILAVVGYVMQDVVADTMSTEIVDRTKDETQVKEELATVQLLSRLTLGLAIFITGWLGGVLADIYQDDYSSIFIFALIFPFISILGMVLISLPKITPTPFNKVVLFTGLVFAMFVVIMGYNDVPYSQEIVFMISLGVVLYLIRSIIHDLDPKVIKLIILTMIIIFVYRSMPNVGDGLTWWQIDVLGFDENFFATLSAISGFIALMGIWLGAKFIITLDITKALIFLIIISTVLSFPTIGMYYDVHTMLGIDARTIALVDIALSSPFEYISMVLMLTLIAIYAPEGRRGTWFALMGSLMNIALTASSLFTKYLNQIFTVTREVKVDGVVTVTANYSELGSLIIAVVAIGFVVPLMTIFLSRNKM